MISSLSPTSLIIDATGHLPYETSGKPITLHEAKRLDEEKIKLKQTIEISLKTLEEAMLQGQEHAHLEKLFHDIQSIREHGKNEIFYLTQVELGSQITCTRNKRKYIEANLQVYFETEFADKFARITRELKNIKKLSEQSFPSQLAITHSDFVDFIFNSRLAYMISSFRNSTEAGPQNHGIWLDNTGHPHIKMNGEWKPWREIKEFLNFDPVKTNCFFTTKNPKEHWNYISPAGLVVKERYDYQELYPVEELSQSEYERVLSHAQSFYNGKPDSLELKDAVLQVVTTYQRGWLGYSVPQCGGLTRNLSTFTPDHVSFHVITKEKKVYSFGFQPKPEEAPSGVFDT
ncbi:MAG: hypothetical protein JWO53_449, partial [Chlamydiia bacterium]|nr:hypothetical protein [Chlamydiia bacterium]